MIFVLSGNHHQKREKIYRNDLIFVLSSAGILLRDINIFFWKFNGFNYFFKASRVATSFENLYQFLIIFLIHVNKRKPPKFTLLCLRYSSFPFLSSFPCSAICPPIQLFLSWNLIKIEWICIAPHHLRLNHFLPKALSIRPAFLSRIGRDKIFASGTFSHGIRQQC